MHVKTIKQHDAKDCGAACLCTIGYYCGKKHTLRFMRSITHTGQNGVSLLGIMEGADRIGIDAEAYLATIEELIIVLKEKTFPIIIHLNSNHFVVAYGIRNNQVLVSDPAYGRRKLSIGDLQEKWSGYLVVFSDRGLDKDAQEKHFKMASLIRILKGNWKCLFHILFMSFALLGFSMGSAYIYQTLMDYGQMNLAQNIHDKSNVIVRLFAAISNYGVVCLFVFMVFLAVMTMAISMIKGKMEVVLDQKLDIALMDDYVSKIYHSKLGDLLTRMTGDYVTRITDLSAVRGMISGMLVSFLVNTILFVFGSILLVRINLWLYTIAVVTLFIYFVLIFVLRKPYEAIMHSVMNANAEAQTYFKESIQGIELVKANHMEDEVHSHMMKKYVSLKRKSLKGSYLGMYSSSVCDFIDQISKLIIIFAGFDFASKGVMSLGELMTFFMLLSLLEDSAAELVSMQLSFQSGLVSIDRLKDIEYLEDEPAGEIEASHISEIQVKDLAFSYFGQPPLFMDLSFSITGRRKIAIIGENGCGKSTLLRIIMGLERPMRGQVCVNGITNDRIKLCSLRERISYVPQTPFLFADTLLYNITLGKDYPIDEVKEVCFHAGLGEFLEKSPQGLELFIDENAANLSAGQKQSIAIARALIRKPDVLMLDEATCNMDASREKMVISYLMNLDIPCIFVTHDQAIINKADHLIRIGAEK